MKIVSILLTSLISVSLAHAQLSRQQLDSIRTLTDQDYRLMLAQLNIDSLRPGPSGNPKAPNAANTDESKATQYTSLPDPLIMNRGGKVVDADTWWKKRRPEIVELFDREIYGRLPEHVPEVTWSVTSVTRDTVENIPVIVKKISGHVDNSSYPSISVDIPLTLTVPAKAPFRLPVILEFGFIFPPGFKFPEPPPGTPKEINWRQLVLSKGWGYAILVPSSYQADWGSGLTKGIIEVATENI